MNTSLNNERGHLLYIGQQSIDYSVYSVVLHVMASRNPGHTHNIYKYILRFEHTILYGNRLYDRKFSDRIEFTIFNFGQICQKFKY